MGAKMGNKNAIGNKGGARKSAYQELADAQELHRMFFEEQDILVLQEKIKNKKYRMQTIMLLKGLLGNDRVFLAIFNKLFPDTLKHQGDIDNPIIQEVIVKIQK